MLILILIQMGVVRLEPDLQLIPHLLLISLLRPLHGVKCHGGQGLLGLVIRQVCILPLRLLKVTTGARIFFWMVGALRHNHILAHVLMTLGVLSHVGKHVGVLKVEKATRLSHQAVREERVPDRTEKHSE
jgi:hypothetical protein